MNGRAAAKLHAAWLSSIAAFDSLTTEHGTSQQLSVRGHRTTKHWTATPSVLSVTVLSTSHCSGSAGALCMVPGDSAAMISHVLSISAKLAACEAASDSSWCMANSRFGLESAFRIDAAA